MTAFDPLMPPEQCFSLARGVACKWMPYRTSILRALVPVLMPGFGTFGVSADAVLRYDPALFSCWSVEETAGVLLHEVEHVLRKHFARRGERDPRRWNESNDREINDDLIDGKIPLPDEPLVPEDIGAKRGLIAEQYYALEEAQKRQTQNGNNGSPQPGQTPPSRPGAGSPGNGPAKAPSGAASASQPSGAGTGAGAPFPGSSGAIKPSRPGVCRGHCGGAAGWPLPGEPVPVEHGHDAGAEDAPEGATTAPKGRSEAELDAIIRECARATEAYAEKHAGKVPSGILRAAKAALKPPRIPWTTKLARVVRGACAEVAGQLTPTYQRISRRQWGAGLGANAPRVPALSAPRPRVCVPIDTSASMSQSDLADALREVRAIMQSVGSEIDFIACDAKVHSHVKVRSIDELVKHLKGGGGTSFIPVFNEIEKQRVKPHVVICCTDGFGTAPKNPPRGIRVIWVLVGKHTRTPAAWGEVIETRDRNDK